MGNWQIYELMCENPLTLDWTEQYTQNILFTEIMNNVIKKAREKGKWKVIVINIIIHMKLDISD